MWGTILRDFLNFWTWQRQKQNKSARLPQFLTLTTSKTKQFCETSSFFKVDNIKNERIMRDVLQIWKVECRADSLVPMRFAIFPLHLSKVWRLPRKSDARSYKVLHLSRKIIFPKLKIWCSKMQPFSGNQRRDLLTALMNMSLVLRLPREMHFARSSAYVPCLPAFLKLLQTLHILLTFDKVRNPLRLPRETTSERPKVFRNHQFFLHFWLWSVVRATTACTFSTSQLQKVVRTWCVLYILTSTCASRHNGVHFFDISTAKSGPNLVCFDVFCTFWLRHVLRATTACTFSTSQLPKVVRTWCVLYILTLTCASRHNGVHFFDIATSESVPELRCFVHFDFETCFAPQRRALLRHLNFQKWSGAEVFCTVWLGNVLRATTACNFSSLIWPAGSAPAALASLLFDLLEPQIIGKKQCFATFRPFRAPGSSFFGNFLFLIFFLLLFSSLPFTLPISAFDLSILSEVGLLNFLR